MCIRDRYIAQLQKVDTSKIIPTNQVTGLTNIFREDVVSPSLSQEDALKNVRNIKNGFIQVKGILNSE